MSEIASMRSRRSSTSTRATITNSLSTAATTTATSTNSPLQVQCIRNFTRSSYMDSFKFFTSALPPHEFIENDLLTDILKCLCDEKLGDTSCLHLLALLEHFHYLITEPDKLEQACGSLINLLCTRSFRSEVHQKFLCTITNLLLGNYELIENNKQIEEMFSSYVTLLICEQQKESSPVSVYANECLAQIGNFFPNILADSYKKDKICKENLLLHAHILKSGHLNSDDLEGFMSKFTTSQLFFKYPFEMHRVLLVLYDYLMHKKADDGHPNITPMIFQPLLVELIYSAEIQNFHLAVQLLRFFGSLFNTYLEQKLIEVLLNSSTHPALITAHRLLLLDFIKTVFDLVFSQKGQTNKSAAAEATKSVYDEEYEPSWGEEQLQIQPWVDGPDTQEKKLAILMHLEPADERLLSSLKPLKELSFRKHNQRASDALYRVINQILEIRPSMSSTIEYLLLSMILRSPVQHVSRTLSLLQLKPMLCENVLQLILQETLNHTDNFHNEQDLREYFLAFDWILRKKDFKIEQKDTINILDFILQKSEHSSLLYEPLAICCSSIIRNQYLTETIKQKLLEIFDFLGKKSEYLCIELVSWVQIYRIALQSLPQQMHFREIFNDQIAFEGPNLKYLRSYPSECPLRVIMQRIPNQFIDLDFDNLQFELSMDFTICINQDFHDRHPEVFCLEFAAICPKQKIKRLAQIDYLQADKPHKFQLSFQLEHIEAFELSVLMRFVSNAGIVHKCDEQRIPVKLIDCMLPTNLTYKQFLHFWQELLYRPDWFRSIICLNRLTNQQQLFDACGWLHEFTIRNDQFAILLPNSIVVLAKIMEVNDKLCIKLITNVQQVIRPFQNEFQNLL